MYKKHDSIKSSDSNAIKIIFQTDEMALRSVPAEMKADELLKQKAIFFLKDVCRCLGLTPADLKRRAHELERQHQDAWRVMGIRKTWTHWIVRMSVFSNYFQAAQPVSISRIHPEWDANTIMSQEGCFLLAEVCSQLPFTASQVRQVVRNESNSRERFGVWKDPNHKGYLVDMPNFSKWIREVWCE